THLHPTVTFTALCLLQCLEACFPAAKGSSGHCLFISAFMLASKIICNDTYSNKSWCIIGQGMFALWDMHHLPHPCINQMDWEMCSYLEQVNVDLLCNSESHIHHNFAGPGPYLLVPAPFTHCSNPSPSRFIPSFTAHVTDTPVIPSPPINTPHPSPPPPSP
ncbi:hypothetical protein V8E53_002603, partial [Lactarius tabidus]